MSAIVTIGLPFYNNETTLTDAIRSIYAQTFTEWELLLIDDGSSDGSLNLALESQARNPRVRVISDGGNRGLAVRLNQIATLAEGKYLARMDADDLMHPERLEQQLELISAVSGPDLVGSPVWVIDEHGAVTGKRKERKASPSAKDLLQGHYIVHPTVLGHVEWFRTNAYDERLRRTEDLELWVRTFDSSRYVAGANPLLFYREQYALRPAAYIVAMREQRAIIKRYGPSVLGKRDSVVALTRVVAKEQAAKWSSRFGNASWMVRQRNADLTAYERHEAERVLRMVQSIPF